MTRRTRVLKFTAIALALFTVAGHGQKIAVPATAYTAYTLTDYSLAAGVAAGRALDFTSTRECLRRAWCTEKELPIALPENKAGFIAYETAATAGSLGTQYWLIKHGHRKLARAVMGVSLTTAGVVVTYNYDLDGSH
jgi:hypothetical protein